MAAATATRAGFLQLCILQRGKILWTYLFLVGNHRL